jgi:hypothetical protein
MTVREVATMIINTLKQSPPKSEDTPVQVDHDKTTELAHRYKNRNQQEQRGEADYNETIG